jgi:hypothetical protein
MGGWRKAHCKEIQNLYFTLSFTGNDRGWPYGTRGEVRTVYRTAVFNLMRKYSLEVPAIDRRMIMKSFLKKLVVNTGIEPLLSGYNFLVQSYTLRSTG